MAVQDGPVRFLFDNTGNLYFGRGFEMLAALEANFKPATFSHAFATLLSLVNDILAEEGIHEFWAHFEGHLHDMSRSTVSIPPILQAMLFLRALHPRYKAIIDLFASKQKDISVASINSIALDAQFMDELSFFGFNGNPGPVTDDALDTAYPPELSQVESMRILLLSMTLRLTALTLHWIHYSEIICRMARRTIPFQSALDSGLPLFSCFQGFWGFWQVLALSGWLNPHRLVSFCLFVLDARMGGVPPSVLDPLVVA
jgi:hypothetical protein